MKDNRMNIMTISFMEVLKVVNPFAVEDDVVVSSIPSSDSSLLWTWDRRQRMPQESIDRSNEDNGGKKTK